jgi:inorganic triphosphatase YgiF
MAIRETVEREVKLRAGENFTLPELGGEAIEPRLFVSTYHDTDDHRLARRGITLRHRVENGRALSRAGSSCGRSSVSAARLAACW